MSTEPKRSLLSAAQAFIRSSARTAAVVAIVPLAAVSLANTAHAQTVFSVPPSGGYSYPDGSFSSSGFSSVALPTSNGITGVKVAGSGSFIAFSGFSDQTAKLFLGNTNNVTGSVLNSGTVIPIAYNFTLSPGTGTSAVSWALDLNINGVNETVASGSGTGLITGQGSYSVIDTITPTVTYSAEMDLTFNTTGADSLSVVMNPSTDALSINPLVSVPEPSTTALVLGWGALGFAWLCRSRRSVHV